MKVAITGAGGLFGRGLVEVLRSRHTVFPLTRAEADITHADQVRAVVERLRPEVVIHAAAIPDLDISEADPAKAFQVNVHGTRNVAEAAQAFGAAVAYISTDAVFDGKKRTPYAETDPVNPPTVYGRTKARAEKLVEGLREHWIFRVSILFGPGGSNFVEKALRQVMEGKEYRVASDQIASATYTLDAARTLSEVVEARRYGLYHLSNQGACTRVELAQHAVELAGLDRSKVVGAPSAQLGRRAVRLQYSVMEMGALKREGFTLPPPWQDALGRYVRAVLPSLGVARVLEG